MVPSRRLGRLGSGVFARNDLRKQAYRLADGASKAWPLVDLSLGSTDLLPPDLILQAMRTGLQDPESSSYCLHAATKPFREVSQDVHPVGIAKLPRNPNPLERNIAREREPANTLEKVRTAPCVKEWQHYPRDRTPWY